MRHPRCVSNNSNYKVHVYIVKHNYILGGTLFTICKAQLHVSALNASLYTCEISHLNLPPVPYIQPTNAFFFIVAPCILITLMFLLPTNALLYYTYKMLKYTVKTSHYCAYMFRSIWTIIRELMPNLARVTMFFKDMSLNVQQCW